MIDFKLNRPLIILSLLLTTCLPASYAQAGKLNDLESASTTSNSRSSSSSNNSTRHSSSSSSSRSGGIGEAIVGALAEVMVRVIVEVSTQAISAGVTTMAYAGENSLQRYQRTKAKKTNFSAPNSEAEYDEFQELEYENSLFRKEGDPILPTIRLSSQWLSASGDINAQLYRAEAGYGLIGVSFSQNNLQERGDTLALSNALIHYRMSFGNNFSWDLAFGSGKMNGNQQHNGSVFAMPMRYRYNKDWHFEYYPVWTDYKNGSLAEHQFSFNYHYKHLGATLGYKTWSAGSTSVDGVFTGLYLSF